MSLKMQAELNRLKQQVEDLTVIVFGLVDSYKEAKRDPVAERRGPGRPRANGEKTI